MHEGEQGRGQSFRPPGLPAPATSVPRTGLPGASQPSREAPLMGPRVQAAWFRGYAPGPAAASEGIPLLHPLQTVEPVDQLLRKVDPAKDRELWVREHKTGNIRPVDMEI